MFTGIEVGKLFKEGVYSYNEGIKIDINDTGINIVIAFGNPTDKEILSMKEGNFKIGFLKSDSVILFLVKYGDMQWMDAPYSVHLSKNLTNLETIKDNESGYAVHTFFVDANTGILKVARVTGLKNNLSKKLKDKIMEQKKIPYDEPTFVRELCNLYARDTEELVKFGTFF